MEERGHVNDRGLRLIGKAGDDVQDVIGNRLTGIDRDWMTDDGSFVTSDRCVCQRTDHQPRKEANAIDTIDEILRTRKTRD